MRTDAWLRESHFEDSETRAIQMSSCSCLEVCEHKSVYTLDEKGNIHESYDGIEFYLTYLNKEFNKNAKVVSITPTVLGTIGITEDNEIIVIDEESTAEESQSLCNSIEMLTRRYGNKTDKKIAQLMVNEESTIILMDDGSATFSSTIMSEVRKPSPEDSVKKHLKKIDNIGYIIESDLIVSSTGQKATKVATLTRPSRNDVILFMFDNSKEIVALDVAEGRMHRETFDSNVIHTSLNRSEMAIVTEQGKLYSIPLKEELGDASEYFKSMKAERMDNLRKIELSPYLMLFLDKKGVLEFIDHRSKDPVIEDTHGSISAECKFQLPKEVSQISPFYDENVYPLGTVLFKDGTVGVMSFYVGQISHPELI